MFWSVDSKVNLALVLDTYRYAGIQEYTQLIILKTNKQPINPGTGPGYLQVCWHPEIHSAHYPKQVDSLLFLALILDTYRYASIQKYTQLIILNK